MGLASVTFPGLQNVIGGEFTLRRGVRPSIATVWIVPQDGLNLPPGTLTFTLDGTQLSFPEARIETANLRMEYTAKYQRWAVQIADRRWKWTYGNIDGEYNIRLPDGTTDTQERKNPQELLTLLFEALGEQADLSRVPTNVWPYVNWVGANPAQEIQKLCDSIACTVVLGTDNQVVVWPLGVGVDESRLEEGFPRHQRFRVTPRLRPQRVMVVCGPTRYQVEFETAAIGREDDGEQKLIDELTYAPESWGDESPWNFPTVNSDPAFDSVWRWYRASGIGSDGSWAVPGSTVSVTKLKQLLPLYEDLIDTAKDLDGVKRPLLPYVQGDYWAYGDGPANTDDERYTGPFKLETKLGVVKFPWPVFQLSDGQKAQEADIKLTASFNVRNEDGALEKMFRTVNVGGQAGDLVLQHPEIFPAKSPSRDTFTEAQAEADAYLQFFLRKFQGEWAQEREYAGFGTASLDGNVAQVRWSCAQTRYALTHIGFRGEFDVFNRTEAM